MRSFLQELHDHTMFTLINESWYDELRDYVINDGAGAWKIASNFDDIKRAHPYEGGTLYRGLNFMSPAEYLSFRRSTKSGYIDSGMSSWSREYSTAVDFAKNRKVYTPTRQVMAAYDQMNKTAERIMGFIGVVLEVKVGPNIGIDVNASGAASEDEVILPKGKYHITKIHYEKQYKHILKGIDYNAAILEWIKSDPKNVSNDVQWIIRNQKQALYPQTLTAISDAAAATLGKTLKLSAEVTPHSKYSFKDVILFPDGEFDVYATWGGPFVDVAGQLDINISRADDKTRAKFKAAFANSLKQLKDTYRIRSSSPRSVKYAFNYLRFDMHDFPRLKTYYASMYKRHDEEMRKLYAAGKEHSRASSDLTREMTDTLSTIGMW